MIKKRIAVHLAGDLLSEHFGHCQAFAFVDAENKAHPEKLVANNPYKPLTPQDLTEVIINGVFPVLPKLKNLLRTIVEAVDRFETTIPCVTLAFLASLSR